MARMRAWRRGITHDLHKPKHLHAIPSHLRVRGETASSTVSSGPTVASSVLLKSFPIELLARIFTLALLETIFHHAIHSWTYTFIPVRVLLSHNLSQVCSSWRDIFLRGTLSSRSNRGGHYLGATIQELATVRQWLPCLDLRGCLLIAGDPNSLLLASMEATFPGLRAILCDSSALGAVEAIEWVEASTASCADVGYPPDIEQSLLEVCNHHAASKPKPKGSIDHAEYRKLVTQEIALLALKLCSNILEFLSLFPNLETTELPVWVVLIPSIREFEEKDGMQATESSIVHQLGEKLVSIEELACQFTTFVKKLRGMNLVGYPLGLFGVFLWETKTPTLQKYLGPGSNRLIENQIRQHFSTVDAQNPLFHRLFDHLKALSWRAICRFELLSYGEIMRDLLFNHYKGRPSLEGFSATDRITNVDSGPATIPLLSTPVLRSSTHSMKSLTLCLTPFHPDWKLGDFDLQGVLLHHHCHFISRFAEILPVIEHLDLTVPSLCVEALTGTSRPRVPGGTLILTISPQPCLSCPAGDAKSLRAVNSAVQILRQMRAAQDRFSGMKDWDVQIRSDEFEHRRQALGFKIPQSLVMLPAEGSLLLSRLSKVQRRGHLVWEQSYCDEPVSVSTFERWVKNGHEDPLWSGFQYPWSVADSDSGSEDSEDNRDGDK
ncbi:hypothetical protein BKA70DRAFT_1567271 [Coprinopsis sp. MPI-PUGE-AT-0042]|nr:hypothetical protein BKA70DRAFT_1567271 [Coprinopsis sp. MPI-PUGE-AT-0042]